MTDNAYDETLESMREHFSTWMDFLIAKYESSEDRMSVLDATARAMAEAAAYLAWRSDGSCNAELTLKQGGEFITQVPHVSGREIQTVNPLPDDKRKVLHEMIEGFMGDLIRSGVEPKHVAAGMLTISGALMSKETDPRTAAAIIADLSMLVHSNPPTGKFWESLNNPSN